VLGSVSDEGDIWETRRSLERLTKEIDEQSAMLAGFLGVLKDEMCQTPGVGTEEEPIAAYPNLEHMEGEGQQLLPEQLKMILKALARSNQLGGEAGYPAALAALYALNLPPISTLVSRTFAAC
jgi:hypothetical protein